MSILIYRSLKKNLSVEFSLLQNTTVSYDERTQLLTHYQSAHIYCDVSGNKYSSNVRTFGRLQLQRFSPNTHSEITLPAGIQRLVQEIV